jgi:hypothetical protein
MESSFENFLWTGVLDWRAWASRLRIGETVKTNAPAIRGLSSNDERK